MGELEADKMQTENSVSEAQEEIARKNNEAQKAREEQKKREDMERAQRTVSVGVN